MTLRLAILSPFSPLTGGIARFSDTMLAAFRQHGHDMVPVPIRAIYPSFFPGRASRVMDKGAALVLYNPLTWLPVFKRLSAMKPDIVLVPYWSWWQIPFCAALYRLTSLKVVLLLHNVRSHERFPGEAFLLPLLAASADGVLALSESVARQGRGFLKAIPQRILYHPVYDAPKSVSMTHEPDLRSVLGYGPEVPVLLFYGYVRRYKGLDILLHALPQLIVREPRLRLLVAGTFLQDPGHYQAIVKQLGLDEHVQLFPGYVSPERTAAFFAAADAVVLPYRSASQSGVIQLAYGFGRPVIVTPAGALPEMVEDGKTGWIAPDTTANGIAAAIGSFLDSRARLPQMQSQILLFRQHFSWEEFVEQASIFFETLSPRQACRH